MVKLSSKTASFSEQNMINTLRRAEARYKANQQAPSAKNRAETLVMLPGSTEPATEFKPRARPLDLLRQEPILLEKQRR
jgi:hypothetical protein